MFDKNFFFIHQCLRKYTQSLKTAAFRMSPIEKKKLATAVSRVKMWKVTRLQEIIYLNIDIRIGTVVIK